VKNHGYLAINQLLSPENDIQIKKQEEYGRKEDLKIT
jgi:hypothetical protein